MKEKLGIISYCVLPQRIDKGGSSIATTWICSFDHRLRPHLLHNTQFSYGLAVFVFGNEALFVNDYGAEK
nr:hypothetical protein [Tanacetum cinerariifolium]